MKNRLEGLKRLKELYLFKAFGQRYIEHQVLQQAEGSSTAIQDLQNRILHCRLCQRSKIKNPIFGILNPNARIVFVTITPIINEKNQFLQNRTSKILQDIIQNIFNFSPQNYSILSLLKCADTYPTKEEFSLCKSYVLEQIKQHYQAITLCFGGKEFLDFFGLKDRNFFGKLIELQGQRLLVTHSLVELLKNPSLKKETMQHLLILKEVL